MSLGDRVRAGADSAAILDGFLGWVAEQGLAAYPEQEEAILELLADRHVVLSTPTGSGKSLVALALHFRALCAGERSFYCAPVKALVSEKFFALCEEFGADRVGMLTGDASINPARARDLLHHRGAREHGAARRRDHRRARASCSTSSTTTTTASAGWPGRSRCSCCATASSC